MRHDAPFLVKRYARMIGRPESKPRITVAYQAYRLEDCVTFVARERERWRLDPWLRQGPMWIEARGHSATRK